jgi:hypothetical protein
MFINTNSGINVESSVRSWWNKNATCSICKYARNFPLESNTPKWKSEREYSNHVIPKYLFSRFLCLNLCILPFDDNCLSYYVPNFVILDCVQGGYISYPVHIDTHSSRFQIFCSSVNWEYPTNDSDQSPVSRCIDMLSALLMHSKTRYSLLIFELPECMMDSLIKN